MAVSAASEQQIELEPSVLAAWIDDGREIAVIDVREQYERDAGHIAGSRHIALGDLPARADEIDRASPVVFYCRVGSRSAMAAAAFRASGYEAYTMRDGLARWVEEGRAISPEDGYVANH
jgi:rhodanese-related sulfurtransferase